jgi:hypothetical protein
MLSKSLEKERRLRRIIFWETIASGVAMVVLIYVMMMLVYILGG